MQVTITSATKLSAAQLKKIESAVTKKYGQKHELKFETVVDPDVLGGVRLTIGSHQYDATLQYKLDRIEASLLTI